MSPSEGDGALKGNGAAGAGSGTSGPGGAVVPPDPIKYRAMDPMRGARRITFGFGGPPPRDLLILLAVVFVTFSLQFFAATAPLVALLRLTPAVWGYGFLWQLATYPLAGAGDPTLWILLELLIVYWFGRDVFWRLGRRNFWKLLAWAAISAALVAVGVDLAGRLLGFVHPQPFLLMQGQRMLLAITICAFASLYRDATILLFFVLPVQARWFIPLEILFTFIAFLRTRDLAGFLGVCAAVAVTWSLLTRGGLRRGLRELWLRLQQRWMRWRLERLRRRRGLRVVKGGGGRSGGDGGDGGDVHQGPWVH